MATTAGTPRRAIIRRNVEGETRPLSPALLQAVSPEASQYVTDGLFPLDCAGMPLPGDDFLALANSLGDSIRVDGKKGRQKLVGDATNLLQLYRRALYSSGDFSMPFTAKGGKRRTLQILAGHVWGDRNENVQYGPQPAKVCVIGKMLGDDEKCAHRQFVGPTGKLLLETCRKFEVKPAGWYMTNLLKTEHPDGDGPLRQPQIREWLLILGQELRLVRPQYILCLGADAAKALLGKNATVVGMDGRVVEYRIPLSRQPGDPNPIYQPALLMVSPHPAHVLRDPTQQDKFETAICKFGQLTRGLRWDLEEQGLDHRVIDNLDDLKELYHEIQADCEDNLLAIDAEWHGEHPNNSGSYLRTIQLSWKPKSAACISLRHPGGAPRFEGGIDAALEWVTKICRGKRVCGHFLNADLEWLVHEGVDIRPEFSVADIWVQCTEDALIHKKGGFDTALAVHAVDETADFALTSLALRYTTAPRYDVKLDQWKKRYCAEHDIKPKDLDGYGEVANEILEPYACLQGESRVQLGNGSWEKISRLVNSKYSGYVKAFRDGHVVDAQVTGWHRHAVGQKEWFRLRTAAYKDGRHGLTGPVFTRDHKILTQRGKVAVDQIIPGQDRILTEDREFSAAQLSVFLGSLLGDGGYTRRNHAGVGFLWSQRPEKSAYADWKAFVFDAYHPRRRATEAACRSYELPFTRYFFHLSQRFPAHPRSVHYHRKAVITQQLLDNLGDIGLAVWYQDDGTLVHDKRTGRRTSRIYCRLYDPREQQLVVEWLTGKFGHGISYNSHNWFIQISREAFLAFHNAIHRFMHPVMAYKTVLPVSCPFVPDREGPPYYEPIEEVVPWTYAGPRRGNGVRFCLTVGDTGNFLTQIGFVSNCYDADVTRRIAVRAQEMLSADRHHNNCWEAFWMSMRAQPAIFEMKQTGVLIDRERLESLTDMYIEAKANLLQALRTYANWKDFNPASVFQVREFLFGEQLNGKTQLLQGVKELVDPNDVDEDDYDEFVDRVDGELGQQTKAGHIRLRPKGAVSLYLKPIMTTDKRPMRWQEVVERGLEKEKTASTNKMALGILARESQCLPRKNEKGEQDFVDLSGPVTLLRNYRFIDQVLKSILRPPIRDKEGNLVLGSNGLRTYAGGLPRAICDDGRVRTTMYPVKETRRWSSARPPLHNLSERREADLKLILGDKYTHPLRSIIQAPAGHILLEADLIGAELAMAAMLSGDPAMLEHVRRNQLPETDPDFYDIHSNVCCLGFRYDCAPTKAGLASIGKKYMRILAKSVLFGMMYGRGAKAIALAAKEEGIEISVQEAQQLIDTIFQMYPRLQPFFKSCQRRVYSPRWLCGLFGGFRRFARPVDDRMGMDMERQAMNCPIQMAVADFINRAVDHLVQYRETHADVDFRMILQIHDALLFYVPLVFVDRFIDYVLPECMCRKIPIYPTDLDGVPTGTGPYYLGVDTNIYVHWKESLNPGFCLHYGVNPRHAHWVKVDDGWIHPEKPGKIWHKGKLKELCEMQK